MFLHVSILHSVGHAFYAYVSTFYIDCEVPLVAKNPFVRSGTPGRRSGRQVPNTVCGRLVDEEKHGGCKSPRFSCVIFMFSLTPAPPWFFKVFIIFLKVFTIFLKVFTIFLKVGVPKTDFDDTCWTCFPWVPEAGSVGSGEDLKP